MDDKTQNLANITFAEIDNSVDVDDRVEKTDLLTTLSNRFKEAMSILSTQPVGGGPAPGAIGASELVETDAGKEVGKSIVSGAIKGTVDAANMVKDAADFTGKMINPMGNLMLQKKYKEEFGINLDNMDVVDMVMPIFGLTTNDFETAMKEIEPDSAFGQVGSELTAFLVASSLMPGGGLSTGKKAFLKGALGDAAITPRTGNLATLAAELGVENEFVDFLDSYMENPFETSTFERLKARVKGATTDSVLIGTAFLAATKILASKIGQIGLGGAAVTASTTEEGEASPFKTLIKPLIKKKIKPKPTDGIAEVQAPTENQPGIIAFHGSGADFDRFRLDKIGTGEGNQAFGYGLYFTESEDIAKFYKANVGSGNEVTYKGKTVVDLDSDSASYEENIAHMIGQKDNKKDQRRVLNNELSSMMNSLSGIEQAIKDFNTNPTINPLKFRDLPLTIDDAERIKNDFAERVSALNEIEKNFDTIKTKPKGKLYEVGLTPKPEELLDYDVPLGEQNEFIKTRLKKVVEEINLDDAVNLGFDPFEIGEAQALKKAKENMLDPERSVISFLNDWAVFRGKQSTAEKLLDKYGIKGIKYKANQGVGARNVPEIGKNNFVIFDENLINILAKYGIVGPVSLTAMSSTSEKNTQN